MNANVVFGNKIKFYICNKCTYSVIVIVCIEGVIVLMVLLYCIVLYWIVLYCIVLVLYVLTCMYINILLFNCEYFINVYLLTWFHIFIIKQEIIPPII